MKILFVDDDRDFSEKCIKNLLSNGHKVDYSENAEDAKFQLGQFQYDIAIIDLMMPPSFSREGLELLKFIRHSYSSTACLMMTVKQIKTTEIVAEAFTSGGSKDFLDKESSVFFLNCVLLY